MKKYSGFTLIEMLIVMGIIIILMAAGIAGGRFAIQRANRIQKQNAVENIEQAAWGYYTDKRSFPRASETATGEDLDPGTMLEGVLAEYLDAGQFDGGVDGGFWYFVEPNFGQEIVICAELSGETDVGIYCTGNGLENETWSVDFLVEGAVPPDKIYPHDHITGCGANCSEWVAETRSW